MDLRIRVPANSSLGERSIGHTGEELFQSIPERLLTLERDRNALLWQTDFHGLVAAGRRPGNRHRGGIMVAVAVAGDFEEVVARRDDEHARREVEDGGHVREPSLFFV